MQRLFVAMIRFTVLLMKAVRMLPQEIQDAYDKLSAANAAADEAAFAKSQADQAFAQAEATLATAKVTEAETALAFSSEFAAFGETLKQYFASH